MKETLARLTHPEVSADILLQLFGSPLRSKNLQERITDVSDQTVYAILKELVDAGLVNRIERSRRNVIYQLTDKGKRFIEETQLNAEKTLMSLSLDPKKQELILASILVEDMVEDLPEKFKTEENKRKLREWLLEDIDYCRKRIEKRAMEGII
ncbi:MAG: winged helix-turn-helix transcriptional regulator [Candidatus Methanofastidiosia archaeon]|jgi:DNA-binding HxlR family transcriptional regulator